MSTPRRDGTNPRARGTNPRTQGTNPRTRAVTGEWAYEVTGHLLELEAKVDRLLTYFGIDAGQRPDEVTYDERGLFAPGSGWITDEPRTEDDDEPVASPELAAQALADARRTLTIKDNGYRLTDADPEQ